MKLLKKQSWFNNLIDAFIVLYILSIYIFSVSVENNIISRVIFLALLLLLVIYMIKSKTFNVSYYVGLFMAFTAFTFITALWAPDLTAAYNRGITMLQIFALVFFLNNYCANEKKVNFIIQTLIFTGVVFALYVVLYYGFDAFVAGLLRGERMGAEITNVNTIGVTLSLTASLCLWVILYKKNKKRFLYIIPFIICVLIALGSGSKKSLIILFGSAILLTLLRGGKKHWFRNVVLCIVVVAILYGILQLPFFATIRERVEMSIKEFYNEGEADWSTYERNKFIEYGWNYFLQHPFTGIGAANSNIITSAATGANSYLHNNYVELLATMGIFGTLLYYSMFIVPLAMCIKGIIKGDEYSKFAFVLIIILLVAQYAMVDYYSKTTPIYLMLFSLIGLNNKNKYNKGMLGSK